MLLQRWSGKLGLASAAQHPEPEQGSLGGKAMTRHRGLQVDRPYVGWTSDERFGGLIAVDATSDDL